MTRTQLQQLMELRDRACLAVTLFRDDLRRAAAPSNLEDLNTALRTLVQFDDVLGRHALAIMRQEPTT